jgi:probable HAF family extracellular repeat protein
VGVSATSAGGDVYSHAFLYRNGTMTDLGMPPGFNVGSGALGINAGGQVVGYAYSSAAGVGQTERAFLYSSGTMTDLNSLINPGSGWTLTQATAINDSGQIIGTGYYGGGVSLRGFLLTPAEAGDANGDGRVDINDLTIVLANFGQTGATWWQGNFTGDGTVDVNDLTTVLSNFGYGVTAPAGVSAVPEPSALALLVPLVYVCASRSRLPGGTSEG